MRNLGKFLLEKESHAIAAAFLCAVLPIFYLPVGFMASIIVALVTMQKGAKAGFWILVWVALPAVASLVLKQITPFDVLLLRCVLVWLMAIFIRRYAAWSSLILIMTAIGIALVVVAHFVNPDIKLWWTQHLTVYANELSKAESELKFSPAALVDRIAPIATGLLGFIFLGTLLLECLIARWWQMHVVNPGSFAKEFLSLRLYPLAAVVAVVFFVMALLKDAIFIDALPILLLPFLIAGMSLIHCITKQRRKLVALNVAMYVGLIFVPIFMIAGLSAVGFIDSLLNVRKKVIKHESDITRTRV